MLNTANLGIAFVPLWRAVGMPVVSLVKPMSVTGISAPGRLEERETNNQTVTTVTTARNPAMSFLRFMAATYESLPRYSAS
jgi:hypothetical protein